MAGGGTADGPHGPLELRLAPAVLIDQGRVALHGEGGTGDGGGIAFAGAGPRATICSSPFTAGDGEEEISRQSCAADAADQTMTDGAGNLEVAGDFRSVAHAAGEGPKQGQKVAAQARGDDGGLVEFVTA